MQEYYYSDGSVIAIADRVICTVDHPDDNLDLHTGDLGTVKTFTDDGYYRSIGVEWDHPINNGHYLWSYGKDNAEDGYGWWMLQKEICLVASAEQPEFEPAASADIYAMLGMK